MSYDPNCYPGISDEHPYPTMNTARRSMSQDSGYWVGDEEVNGIIIGDVTFPYEFWSYGEFRECVGKTFARNDDEAIAWFKATYPAEFAAGAEMRVFDL